MALNLYGKTNYEVKVPLALTYSREVGRGPDIYQPSIATQWRYIRHATKTYVFKGMTEKATKQCLTAKRQQYMRPFMYWQPWSETTGTGYFHNSDEYNSAGYSYRNKPPYYEQVAQFNVTRVSDAPVFELQITVNETIALYSTRDYDINTLSSLTDIENLFATQTITPVNMRLAGDTTGGPRYNSYLYQYSYDENLSTDIIVP